MIQTKNSSNKRLDNRLYEKNDEEVINLNVFAQIAILSKLEFLSLRPQTKIGYVKEKKINSLLFQSLKNIENDEKFDRYLLEVDNGMIPLRYQDSFTSNFMLKTNHTSVSINIIDSKNHNNILDTEQHFESQNTKTYGQVESTKKTCNFFEKNYHRSFHPNHIKDTNKCSGYEDNKIFEIYQYSKKIDLENGPDTLIYEERLEEDNNYCKINENIVTSYFDYKNKIFDSTDISNSITLLGAVASKSIINTNNDNNIVNKAVNHVDNHFSEKKPLKHNNDLFYIEDPDISDLCHRLKCLSLEPRENVKI